MALLAGCSSDATVPSASDRPPHSSTTTGDESGSAQTTTPPVAWDAPVGSLAVLTSSDTPTEDSALAVGVVVPVEEPGLAADFRRSTSARFFRLDDTGHVLVANLPLNLTGCSQISTLDVVGGPETVTVEIWIGPFTDLVGGCEQPGGTVLVPVEVPNGLGSRTLRVAGCDGSIPGCEPEGLLLEDLPRVHAIAKGCVPSRFLPGGEMPARNHERVDACDDARMASEWNGWFE